MLNAWWMCALVVATGAAEKPKLIVMELTAAGGVEPAVASVLGEAVTTEVAQRGFFEVLAAKEVQTLLGLERQKQLVGCDEGNSCLTELAGALGARFVLSGSVAKLGDAYQLSLQTLDSQKAQPIGRSTRLAKSLEELRAQLPWAVAEATSTPLPPPPSRLLSYSLIGAGAVALVTGGILGQDALSRQRSVNEELDRGTTPGVLGSYSEYRQANAEIGRGKTFALVGLALGVGLIGAGFYWMPSDVPRARGEVNVAVVPSGNGVAVTGGFW